MKKNLSKALLATLALMGGFAGLSAQAYPDGDMKRKSSPGRPLSSSTMLRRPAPMAALTATGEGKNFRASVLYTDSWESSGNYLFGIYEFPAEGTYSSTPVYVDNAYDATGSAALIGDRYFWTSYQSAYGYTLVDNYIAPANDWSKFTKYDGSELSIARALAWDHVTGTLFGCFRINGGAGWIFGTLNPDSADRIPVKISDIGSDRWSAMSVDRIGRLFVITESGKLYRVDKTTGAMTEIGDTGVKTKYVTSGTIDPESGKFYYVPVLDAPTYLYTIDLETAKATPVYLMSHGEQLTGMHFPQAAVSASVPAKATDLKATFDHTTLKGTVSFTAPSKTAGGNAGSGTLSYKVYANGTAVADGTTAWGGKVSREITLKESGEYAFEVVTSTAAGNSESAWVQAYVGTDSPAAIESVDMVNFGDRFILSWTPVTTAAHGGNINPSEVTYTVVRYPEGKVVAQSTKATSFTEVIEATEPVTLYYTVTPEYGSFKGVATKSQELLYGAYNTPYSVDLTDSEQLKEVTIVDANNDNRKFLVSVDDDNNPCLYLYPVSITNADDYVFSAPINLKKGILYRMSAVVSPRMAKYGCKDNIDLVVATAPTASAVVAKVLENEVVKDAKQEPTANFKVDKDGVYYIAIHGCGSPDSYGLYAYSMSITSDAIDTAPAAPELSAVRNGSDITVKVTTPTHLINGQAAGELTAVNIFRNGEKVFTKTSPAKGVELVFEDKGLADGLYVYTATVANSSGDGEAAEARAYVGINIPAAPTDVVAKEHEDYRTVTVTWKAPEFDRDGCPIDPEVISYTLAYFDGANLKWIPIINDIKDTSVTYEAVTNTSQILVKYGVIAATSKGKNEYDVAVAPIVSLGQPYKMPYVETFGGTSLSGVLGEENENESASWQIMYNYDQDGTGGSLFYTGAIGKRGSMFTGKIMIEGENPTFSFWFWSIPTSPEGEDLTIEANDGTGYREIGRVPLNQGGAEQHWEKFSVAIDEFIGKPTQFRISYLLKKYVLYIDHIRVCETYVNNLTAHNLIGYSHVTPGYTYTYFAEIENSSERESPAYTVSVVDENGQRHGSVEMPSLKAGERAMAEVPVDITLLDGDMTFYGLIEDEDENSDDNKTPAFAVTVVHADVPVVNDLKATRVDNTVNLTWSKPAVANESEQVTDGADRLVAFSTGLNNSKVVDDNVGDWTMINADGAGSAGLVGFEHPNIYKESDMGFIVWNPSLLGIIVKDWQPRSGLQSFVCLCAPVNANDDWMVSPLLSGKEQTVTFYAKAVNDTYNECFEFGYSTTGTAKENFTMNEKVTKVPGTWTKYSYKVPAGSKHFAIRCTSNRQFALFIDDITFERANPNFGATPKHYVVYRDNKRYEASNTAGYTDDRAADAHTYRVTAVYDRGESQASNEVAVGPSAGIEGVAADASPSIIAGKGYAEILNADGMTVTVATLDGRVVNRFIARSAEVRIALAKGVYVVSAGSEARKVIID